MSELLDAEFPMRLNRYIALCGVAARRKAEVLIASGRVTVGGAVETSVGRVLDGSSEVCVDGRAIAPVRSVYIVMNKPAGILSAASDARERTVLDLLPKFYRPLGLFPVGRLDKESEGLIILTNDGGFAQEIIHPSAGVPRTYMVLLKAPMDEAVAERWRDGIVVDGRLLKPLDVTSADGGTQSRRWRIVLGDGLKREIRVMAEALGNKVINLRRVGIGKLFLKKLPDGAFCEYNHHEINNMISCGGEV
ncbi:MAG: rRNA pseudouridine synthase [Synergistaceae bacterium]|jgi:23S rRNA pseudouridine2605 synthase|nr:rRNA pseudouridine synthase [Synergistaceae bacterium]